MPLRSSPIHPTTQMVPNSVAARNSSHLSTQSEKSWRKISDARMVSVMSSGLLICSWTSVSAVSPPLTEATQVSQKKSELLRNDYVVYNIFIMKPCAGDIFGQYAVSESWNSLRGARLPEFAGSTRTSRCPNQKISNTDFFRKLKN